MFQIAARLAAKTNDNQLEVEGGWDGADKHRVMFVIKKSKLEELGRESAQARYELWHHGHLHFVLSAPRGFLRLLADESGTKIGCGAKIG